VIHVALALAMGCAGAWAIVGRVSVGRATLGYGVWLAIQALLVRRGRAHWSLIIDVLAVPVGWYAAAVRGDMALLVLTAVAGAARLPGLSAEYDESRGNSRCRRVKTTSSGQVRSAAHQATGFLRNRDIAAVGIAYGVVLGATALGAMPVWTLLVMLTVPWAVRTYSGFGVRAWRHWILAFEGQLVLALMIEGMVR
jgi:hypothetical protein